MRSNLTNWQWQGYARNHKNPLNLMLHVFVVPIFWVGTMLIPSALFLGDAAVWIGGIFMAISVALQGLGHRMEEAPPEPFKGFGDFLSRILVEQYVTFPRFVVSGGWSRAAMGGGDETDDPPTDP